LFQSQEVWLAHRQSHRNPQNPPQTTARVDVEHSYRKQGEQNGLSPAEIGAEIAKIGEICGEMGAEAPASAASSVQLLLYECGECLQLFQSPKDFLEHQ
ncbi:ZN574 protein, partial [Prunella fulvescens]|nr:ZN574 protein [Prunella fulvescens]